MSNNEFLNEFNFRFNNLFSNLAPGLDSYEISLLLTLALGDILRAYLNPKANKLQEGVDASLKRLVDFSTLIKVMKQNKSLKVSKFTDTEASECYRFPSDAIAVLNETLKVQEDGRLYYLLIVPLTYPELTEVLSLTYKEPVKNKAWRINTDYVLNDNPVALVYYHTGETPIEYKVRYVRSPHPILLEDFDESDSILGYHLASADVIKVVNGVTLRVPSGIDCELPEELHEDIVKRAVELAKALYQGSLEDIITVGNHSSTDIGIVPLQTK